MAGTAASGCAAAVLPTVDPLPRLPATQRVVTSAADMGAGDYAALDLALRGLAVRISQNPDGRLPDVVAAQLHGGRLEELACAPADRPPPEPWTADDTGLWWFLRLDQDTGVATEVGRALARPATWSASVQTAHAVGCWTWNASAPCT